MKDNTVYIQHILDEIEFILRETEHLNFETFIKDEKLKRACARSLEIIGEAAKQISDDGKAQYADVDWKKICGMRDKLIHLYFGVNWDIVWSVISDRLPALRSTLKKK
jgi:uncharacterized protein with HEPN domain